MHFKINFITIILFLFSFTCFSQEEIYLDENMKEIDSLQYTKRCTFQIFKCLEYKTDSLIINKVLYKYSFGKLTSVENNQIRKLLIKDSNTKIDSNTTLMIVFYDSILSFNTIYKRHLKHNKVYEKAIIDSLNKKAVAPRHKPHEYNEKMYLNNRKKWVKKQKKCIKKFEQKQRSKIIYTYKYGKNIDYGYLDFKWTKDRGVLKHKFFKIMFNSKLLIIKPDGEYFLSGAHFSDKNVKKLLMHSDWNKYKKDWLSSIQKNSSKGVGMFKKESLYNHVSHCF